VTLRRRLAVAFTTILLAPMGLGAAALAGLWGATGIGLGGGPAADDEAARNAVRSVIEARCRQLGATAAGLAATAGAAGQSWAVVPAEVAGPWAICGVDPPPGMMPTGLAARAEIMSVSGEVSGYAYAVQPIDEALLAELSAAADRRVSLAAGVPAGRDGVIQPEARAPLALRLDPPPVGRDPRLLLLIAAGVALLASALLGAWLAEVAIRPLRRLLVTAERASAGDLSVRTALAGRDETGRLGRRLDELIVALQDVRRLSTTDALTGLGNRRHLSEALRREIERAGRFGRCLGVLALDLDHFKEINDRYGHRAGDGVLVEFAARVRRALREVDLAFRYGGEEFVILLPETDISGSMTAARRVSDAVRHAAFPLDGPAVSESVRVTVSVGVAVYPRHARTAVDLLDAADQALYAAKAAGRDPVVLVSDAPARADRAASTPSSGDVTAAL
jgi:diguanylate cyclase (GGDEF)-like protein